MAQRSRVGVEDDQHFKHTTPLAYSSAMSRRISLNLSVSESMTALALRLPLFNYESYTLQLTKETFHGFSTST